MGKHSLEYPDHVLITSPGCHRTAHTDRVWQLCWMMQSVVGYVPEPEVMPCGCLLEVVRWPLPECES